MRKNNPLDNLKMVREDIKYRPAAARDRITVYSIA